jgi:hypothetical protein
MYSSLPALTRTSRTCYDVESDELRGIACTVYTRKIKII